MRASSSSLFRKFAIIRSYNIVNARRIPCLAIPYISVRFTIIWKGCAYGLRQALLWTQMNTRPRGSEIAKQLLTKTDLFFLLVISETYFVEIVG